MKNVYFSKIDNQIALNINCDISESYDIVRLLINKKYLNNGYSIKVIINGVKIDEKQLEKFL